MAATGGLGGGHWWTRLAAPPLAPAALLLPLPHRPRICTVHQSRCGPAGGWIDCACPERSGFFAKGEARGRWSGSPSLLQLAAGACRSALRSAAIACPNSWGAAGRGSFCELVHTLLITRRGGVCGAALRRDEAGRLRPPPKRKHFCRGDLKWLGRFAAFAKADACGATRSLPHRLDQEIEPDRYDDF